MKNEQYKICAVTGHRPSGFPWDYNNKECDEHKEYLQTMEETLEKLISEKGYNYFIAGGAIGVDTDFAETVLRLRESKYPNIKLEIAVPCENQDLKWNQSDKDKYRQILSQADFVNVLSKHYTRFCMAKRNEYMVNKSDVVLAFWNVKITKGGTYRTLKYMNRKKIEYEIIGLDDFLPENKRIDALLYSLADEFKSKMEQENLLPNSERFKKFLIEEGLLHSTSEKNDCNK